MVDIAQFGLAPCKIRSIQVGQTFGRLTVLAFGKKGRRAPHCVCSCACGNVSVVLAANLQRGQSQSCGCMRTELLSERFKAMHTVHGLSRHRLYFTWVGMMRRCYEETHDHYKSYGGRGIRVSNEWLIPENFIRDMDPTYEKGMTLDRVDNDDSYSADNCRWATPTQQLNNTRRNIYYEHEGQCLTIQEW